MERLNQTFSKEDTPYKKTFKQMDLGLLQELREAPGFENFSSFCSGLSFSWVGLKDGGVLESHSHQVESLVMIYSGRALETQSQTIINQGEAVLIPAGCPHGFEADDGDFFGIAMQPVEGTLFQKDMTQTKVEGAADSIQLIPVHHLETDWVHHHRPKQEETFSGLVFSLNSPQEVKLGSDINLEKDQTYLLSSNQE